MREWHWRLGQAMSCQSDCKVLRSKWWSLLILLDKQTYQLRIRRLIVRVVRVQIPIWFGDNDRSGPRKWAHHDLIIRLIRSIRFSVSHIIKGSYYHGASAIQDSKIEQWVMKACLARAKWWSSTAVTWPFLGIVIFPSSSRLSLSHATLSTTIPPTSNLAVTPIDLEKDDQRQSVRGWRDR